MGKVERSTRETRVTVELNLDGSGNAEIEVEDRFLTHMLETLARYGGFDLRVTGEGDLKHHLIEDVAITLGRAFQEEIVERDLIRFSSRIVPMDDALVLVAVDLIDRPYADVELSDPHYRHFLRSFALETGITLHTQVVRGQDRHHTIEATFKALGLALNEATQVIDETRSTKGKVRWRS
ncbi:MAG: imidazoleglycerol-phosphate dehydratase [Candidatus Bipolaricaulia bacterium]